MTRCNLKWAYKCQACGDANAIFDKATAAEMRDGNIQPMVWEMCKLLKHHESWLKDNHPERYCEHIVMFHQGHYDEAMMRIVSNKRAGWSPEDFPFLSVTKLAKACVNFLADAESEEARRILTELLREVRQEAEEWIRFQRQKQAYEDQKNGETVLMAGRKETAVEKAWLSRRSRDFVLHQADGPGCLMDPVSKTSLLVGLGMKPPTPANQVPVISLWNIAEMGPCASDNVDTCVPIFSQRLTSSPTFNMVCVIGNSQPCLANCGSKDERLVEVDTNAHWQKWIQQAGNPCHKMHMQE